jgi:hypothetical protein
LSRSASRGTVINCSTSSAESPSASVCTSALRRTELWQDVQTCVAQLDNAEGHKSDSGRQDQEPGTS